jgi:hypothetical protein
MYLFGYQIFGAPSGDRTRDLALMSHERYHCTRRELTNRKIITDLLAGHPAGFATDTSCLKAVESVCRMSSTGSDHLQALCDTTIMPN